MCLNQSFCLKLSILSFDLPINLIKESENVRVCITTVPEENTQEFTIPSRKMKNPYLNFNLNVKLTSENIPNDFISVGTEALIVVFRKKSFFHSDPIIGFTIITEKEFPRNISESIQLNSIEIFRNLNDISNYNDFCIPEQGSNEKVQNRRKIGKMNVSMVLTDPLQLNGFGDQTLSISSDSSFDGMFKFGQNSSRFKKLNK
ncbi:hypothetical protein M9Y10_004120 [Tritrichomonas musculus]|uniref:Uncharacterized protein n=1 Tax=Tritrichomonas musculus TaxID=1915356 RepID=A0ABR2JR50_9EUKA